VPTERRLAAILAADVVGYSRLMGADEIGTLRALKSLRRDLLDPAISGHRGRIVKTTGDGLLVEFASVVDAVVCAATIQHDLASWPALGRTEDRLTLRIGVNIGDIIIDGADIFGDGVNLASRLEAICEPGGVTFSRAVHEQVRDKLAFPFTDLGEHNVKNIARPVQVFGIGADAIGAMARPVLPGQVVEHSAPAKRAPSEASEQKTRDRGKAGSWRRRFVLIAILALLLFRHGDLRHAVDALIAWARPVPASPASTTTPKPLAPLPPEIFVPTRQDPAGTESATAPPMELHPQD
jgi:class 3 adenylate cyclase